MTAEGQPNFANKTLWTEDNLNILRGMNSACVDLIYLDPPFNSNRTYEAPVGSQAAGAAFKDAWTLSDLDVAWMGLIADEQPGMYAVIEAAGRAHGRGMQSYICMMAVRLLEMHRVLKQIGSVYLHCDPTASHYLEIHHVMQFLAPMRSEARLSGSDRARIVTHDKVGDNTAAYTISILFYTKSDRWTWNLIHTPYDHRVH